MEGSEEQHSSPNTLIHDEQPQQELGFQSPPPSDSNHDLPHADDSIKQIVSQLQHLSLKEVIKGEVQIKTSEQSTDDEEIKLKQAIDEELLHLTVKQAITEALKDESLKQAVIEEIDANQGLSEGVPGHDLRRFIDEALESNLENAKTLTDGEVAIEAETLDVPKGSPGLEVDTVKEKVSGHEEDFAEDENNYVNSNGENENEGDNGDVDVEVKDEVEIRNHESYRSEYENQDSNGWNEDRDEDGVNTYEDYRSENGKEEGYNVNNDNVGGDYGMMPGSKDGVPRKYHYPVRPEAEDCSYYMKTGMCKFGSNCKFNHPLTRKNQFARGQQATKETVKQREEREESSERPGQTECKYYLTPGGCKYGKACKYNHSRGKAAVAPILEFNFLGLPIRLGERECPYYMRTGSCKYGSNCRFNHPDPTAAGGGGDTPSRYGNDGSVSLQSSQTTMPSWSSPRPMNETAPFVPVMYPPTHGIPPNPDWNGYQAPPVYHRPSETGLPTPPAFAMNNPATTDTTTYYPHHHQRQTPVEEYPERPGEPECSFFLKTGDCKYRSNCKFHHPKTRTPKTPPCVLSDKGLPLRPGQNTCTHYSRYGICKFGPACKYDHPVNYGNSTWSEPDEPPSFGNSVTADGLR